MDELIHVRNIVFKPFGYYTNIKAGYIKENVDGLCFTDEIPIEYPIAKLHYCPAMLYRQELKFAYSLSCNTKMILVGDVPLLIFLSSAGNIGSAYESHVCLRLDEGDKILINSNIWRSTCFSLTKSGYYLELELKSGLNMI